MEQACNLGYESRILARRRVTMREEAANLMDMFEAEYESDFLDVTGVLA